VAETQRRQAPLNDGGELDTALAFLRFAREAILIKTEGLDEEQLRRALVPTGTNLLGLVQHLAGAERLWFAQHFAGQDGVEVELSMTVPEDRRAASVLDDYRAAGAASNAIAAAADGPDALTALEVAGQRRTLRWVVAHMTSETARHAGHADFLRELIDGTTGR